MHSKSLPAWYSACAMTFLLSGLFTDVLSQEESSTFSLDPDGSIEIDGRILIVFDKHVMERFYSAFCKNHTKSFTQRLVARKAKKNKQVYEADQEPSSVRVENDHSSGYPSSSFLCRARTEEKQEIDCISRDDAINQCRRSITRDCKEFHLILDAGVSSMEKCRHKCVNIAWRWAREGVSFVLSDRLASRLPVISEGLCPRNPVLQLKTPTATPPLSTVNDNSTIDGERADRGISAKVIVALVIAGVLLLLLIVIVILFVICYRRKTRNKHEKTSIGVQTNSRRIRRWNLHRPAFLTQNFYRNPRNPRSNPQQEPAADNASNSSPYYYEISNVIYEEPMPLRQEDPEKEALRPKDDDYEYRKLRATRSEKLSDANASLLATYGKDSASAEKPRPPDLVPAGELSRVYPIVVPLTEAPPLPPGPPNPSRLSRPTSPTSPTSPPLPKPRNRSEQSTFKIRN